MQSINDIVLSDDYYLVPFFLIIIFLIGFWVQRTNQNKSKAFKYFVWGLLFKIIGVIAFSLVYLYYYEGGDTINYFIGSKALADLFWIDFNSYYDIVFNNNLEWNNYTSFNNSTWFPPWYMWKDPNTFSVCRFTSLLTIISFNSFMVTCLLTACFSYIGIWKIYRLINILYPNNERVFAFLILFMPTLIFWGGGIMKDSYVLGATCWMSYNFFQIFISRKKIIWNILFFALNLFLIINTKSYVIISLLPGMLLWINSAYLKNTKGVFRKVILLPFLIIIIGVVGYYALTNLGELMGVYGNVDSAIQQAQTVQQDLLREEAYGANSYNIGEIDGSTAGMISMAPIAVFTALYRPLFWEIGSPMMVISVIENSILLIITFLLLIRVNPFKIIRIILSEPFLLYALVFSLLFAFGVGIAGTNFGALVRYKIPLVPFYFPMIYLIFKLSRKNKINVDPH